MPREFLLVWFQKATYDSGDRLTKLMCHHFSHCKTSERHRSLYTEMVPVKHGSCDSCAYFFHDFMLQAGVFMGFSITSAVFGGIIIIAYSITIAIANYYVYYHDYDDVYSETYTYRRYSYDAKMGLAAMILVLGIIEFGTGIWVSICLCLMKPCCTDSEVSFRLS